MKSFREAIETGETDFIHPVLRKELESGQEEILEFLPDKAQEYYETILSDNYNKILERVEHYTRIKPTDQTIPQLVSLAMANIHKIMEIEKGKKAELEKMAVELVLGFPQFKRIKRDVEQKQLAIDAKLGNAELENAVSKMDQEKEKMKKPESDGDLSELEQNDIGFINEFKADVEDRLRRRFCNVLTQGEAVCKMYAFNFLKDELDKIDKDLMNKYGMVCSVAELGYFMFDPRRNIMELKMGAMGSEEVAPKKDIYVIKARGIIFPILVQEIVKGIMEYLRMDPNKNVPLEKVKKTLEGDYIEQEIKDTVSGPELAKHINKMIDILDLEYFPYIVQEVDRLPKEDFKRFFKKDEDGEPSEEAKNLMRIIIKKAKKTASEAETE